MVSREDRVRVLNLPNGRILIMKHITGEDIYLHVNGSYIPGSYIALSTRQRRIVHYRHLINKRREQRLINKIK